MLLLLLACSTQPTGAGPTPEPANPEPTVNLDELPTNPSLDAKIAKRFANAADFTTKDNQDIEKLMKALGPAAMPELVRQVAATKNHRARTNLCRALGVLDVKDETAAAVLLQATTGRKGIVPACGSAAARMLQPGAAEWRSLLALLQDEALSCSGRQEIASHLREPSLCPDLLGQVDSPGCAGSIAIEASQRCEGMQAALARVVANGAGDNKTAALRILSERATLDEPVLDVLRERLARDHENEKLDDSAYFLVTLIGKHGSFARDAELITAVSNDAPDRRLAQVAGSALRSLQGR